MPVYVLDLLIAMVKEISVSWDITPCSPVELRSIFRRNILLPLSRPRVIKAINHHKEGRT
jgi:hypothetical protein